MERTVFEKLKPRYRFGDTDVFVGSSLLGAIVPTVSEIFETGNMLLISDAAVKDLADKVSEEFRGNGYKVFGVSPDEIDSAPDFVRFVFGVGAGRVADACKNAAKRLNADCAVLLTAPSDDGVAAGYAPKQIFLDSAVLSDCPRECVAAGWGIILSEPLARFEEYFLEKTGVPPRAIPRFKDLPSDADETTLALRLVEMSSYNRKPDNATVMAELLSDAAEKQGVKKRLLGEYRFVCASVLNVFYGSFLSAPSIDCMPSPSHDTAIDEIVKLTGRNREMLINSFDFFDTNSYFRINYILGEYRLDLLERLRAIDMHAVQKRWRRIYPDAGYWLQKAFTSKILINALRLSSEIGYGLLRYICETGFAA